MNATNDRERIDLQAGITTLPTRVDGFAGKAMRLERRLGWLLWSALLALLVVISA